MKNLGLAGCELPVGGWFLHPATNRVPPADALVGMQQFAVCTPRETGFLGGLSNRHSGRAVTALPRAMNL